MTDDSSADVAAPTSWVRADEAGKLDMPQMLTEICPVFAAAQELGIVFALHTGTQALLWGSDYPHHEGTFPRSREVLAHLFDGIDISEQDKADNVGANAGRLFRVPRPEFLHAV